MIGFRSQKPTCRRPQEIVRRTSPSAMAEPARPASAGWDELSDLALMLGPRGSRLRLERPLQRRREDGEGHEREEPGDVEIEPVGQDELEADENRGRERAQLDHVLPSRDEVDRDGGHEEDDLEPCLDVVQVREARVLVPVPDGEGRAPSELPTEGAIPKQSGRVQNVWLDQEDPEGEDRPEREPTEVQEFLAREPA